MRMGSNGLLSFQDTRCILELAVYHKEVSTSIIVTKTLLLNIQ
jgi:hypothetical protein